MNEFSKKIKHLRGKQSLREASKNIGISHTYLDSLEKGYDPRSGKERKPTPDVIGKLADYYQIEYMKLMELAGYYKLDEFNDDDLGEHLDYLIEKYTTSKDKLNRLQNYSIEPILTFIDGGMSFLEANFLNKTIEFIENSNRNTEDETIVFMSVLLAQLNKFKSIHKKDEEQSNFIYEDLSNEFDVFLKGYLGIEK